MECFLGNSAPLILEMITESLNQQLLCGLGKKVHLSQSMIHVSTKRDISTNTFTPFLSIFLLIPSHGRDESTLLEARAFLRPYFPRDGSSYKALPLYSLVITV